jgi:hypothetical protein
MHIDTILISSKKGYVMSINRSLTSRPALGGYVVVLIVALTIASYFAFATKPAITAINVDSNLVAIHGYDTVAYFTEAKPTKGKKEFKHVWQDANWHFASTTNRDLFATNPDRYAPQYGGYCALGIAAGEFAQIDPEAWAIIDDKLYLNKSKFYLKEWAKAPKAHIFVSEHNWKANREKLRNNL